LHSIEGGKIVVLTKHPTHPQSRAYVLRLRHDAALALGEVSGYIENVSTGRRLFFLNAQELLAALASDSGVLSMEASSSAADKP